MDSTQDRAQRLTHTVAILFNLNCSNFSQLNCYDGWAPDLPDDQPVRSKYNTNGVAYYSTTYGTRYQEQRLISNFIYKKLPNSDL